MKVVEVPLRISSDSTNDSMFKFQISVCCLTFQWSLIVIALSSHEFRRSGGKGAICNLWCFTSQWSSIVVAIELHWDEVSG